MVVTMTVAGLLQGLAAVGAMAGSVGFLAGKVTSTSNKPLEVEQHKPSKKKSSKLLTKAELTVRSKKVK